MRIKKKDVILEATLLDVSSEFNKHEKKLLKVLSKKFGEGGYSSDFDRFAAAAWLIEHMNIPYDVSGYSSNSIPIIKVALERVV